MKKKIEEKPILIKSLEDLNIKKKEYNCSQNIKFICNDCKKETIA